MQADAIIANLTPFRGPGADAGTVYELGYMAGTRQASVSAIPTILRSMPIGCGVSRRSSSRDGRLVDAEGLTVEDFGHNDNLMMIHALDLHGCAAGDCRAKRRQTSGTT